MGNLWTIFKAVFFPPRLPAAFESPDDYPQDGSLHFIDFTAYTKMRIPDTYSRYEFSSNVGEDDNRIGFLSMEIMKQLCNSRQVLMKIVSNIEFSKKQKHPQERFTVQYRRFLEHSGFPVSTYMPDEKTLLLLKKRFDATAYWVNRDICTGEICDFEFYLLPEKLDIPDAKAAAQAVMEEQYDVWFNLSECGPCALYMTFNPKTVDVDALQKIVEQVCQDHQVLFQNPL